MESESYSLHTHGFDPPFCYFTANSNNMYHDVVVIDKKCTFGIRFSRKILGNELVCENCVKNSGYVTITHLKLLPCSESRNKSCSKTVFRV